MIYIYIYIYIIYIDTYRALHPTSRGSTAFQRPRQVGEGLGAEVDPEEASGEAR